MSLVADARLDGEEYDEAVIEDVVEFPNQSWLIDFLVFGAIALTAVAIAIALQGEVGFSPGLAMVIGVIAFISFGALHIALRRIDYRGRLAAALAMAPAMDVPVPPQQAAPSGAVPVKPPRDEGRAAAPPMAPKPKQPVAAPAPATVKQPDPWSMRPGDLQEPGVGVGMNNPAKPGLSEIVPASRMQAAKESLGKEQDPEMIEQVLTRIARDLNVVPQPAAVPAPSYAVPGAPRPPEVSAPPPVPPANAAPPETSQGKVQDKLAAIASALAQEHVDVFLSPIAGLEGDGVAHFEVAVRLRLDDGAVQDREEYGAAASGTPLLPLIDTLAIAKGRKIAWRVFRPEEDGRVFTAIDCGSLTDKQFLEDFDSMVRGDAVTAKRLVMSFGQSEARALTRGQTETLARLAASGFAFAVDDLVDMDMDFAALSDAGFSFVKVDADIFLDGMPVGTGHVPADDICRHLKSFGLQPIVEEITDRAQLQRLRACGVAYGQGPLLGGSHVVKSEWLEN